MQMKEATELLELGEALAKALAEAKKDGDINWMDLPKFASVVGKAKAAVEGGDKIDDEFKAANAEQLAAFSQRALQLLLNLTAVVISK
jgi:hypothetical protein